MAAIDITHQNLKEMIISSLQLEDVNIADMKDDEPLFGGRLELDSVDALELVVAIEGRYGVKIRSEDVQAEDFKSLTSLFEMIRKRLSQQAPNP
jgi:acyl carrier protein